MASGSDSGEGPKTTVRLKYSSPPLEGSSMMREGATSSRSEFSSAQTTPSDIILARACVFEILGELESTHPERRLRESQVLREAHRVYRQRQSNPDSMNDAAFKAWAWKDAETSTRLFDSPIIRKQHHVVSREQLFEYFRAALNCLGREIEATGKVTPREVAELVYERYFKPMPPQQRMRLESLISIANNYGNHYPEIAHLLENTPFVKVTVHGSIDRGKLAEILEESIQRHRNEGLSMSLRALARTSYQAYVSRYPEMLPPKLPSFYFLISTSSPYVPIREILAAHSLPKTTSSRKRKL